MSTPRIYDAAEKYNHLNSNFVTPQAVAVNFQNSLFVVTSGSALFLSRFDGQQWVTEPIDTPVPYDELIRHNDFMNGIDYAASYPAMVIDQNDSFHIVYLDSINTELTPP